MPHPAKGYTSYLATGSNRSNGRRPHPDNTTHLATSSIHGEHRNDPCSSSTKHQGDLSWMPWKSVVLLAPRKVLLRSLALEALASEMARYRMRCLCGAKYRRCIGWRAQQESLTRIQMTWLRVAPGGSTFSSSGSCGNRQNFRTSFAKGPTIRSSNLQQNQARVPSPWLRTTNASRPAGFAASRESTHFDRTGKFGATDFPFGCLAPRSYPEAFMKHVGQLEGIIFSKFQCFPSTLIMLMQTVTTVGIKF